MTFDALKARIPRRRHRHPRDDPREDVRVDVVECGYYATSVTSVHPSVTLMACDHTVQQKVEMGMTEWIGVFLAACRSRPRS